MRYPGRRRSRQCAAEVIRTHHLPRCAEVSSRLGAVDFEQGGSVIGAWNARARTMATADPVDRAIDAVAREDAPPAARPVAPSAEDAPILLGDDVSSADASASASALAESTPSWFDVNAFQGEDFDAGEYVESPARTSPWTSSRRNSSGTSPGSASVSWTS